MATQSPPSKEESTLIIFFDGSKRGQKSQVAVKSSNPLCSLDLINFGSGQSSIFQGDWAEFLGAVKTASESQSRQGSRWEEFQRPSQLGVGWKYARALHCRQKQMFQQPSQLGGGDGHGWKLLWEENKFNKSGLKGAPALLFDRANTTPFERTVIICHSIQAIFV
jgi:hypothetical protein